MFFSFFNMFDAVWWTDNGCMDDIWSQSTTHNIIFQEKRFALIWNWCARILSHKFAKSMVIKTAALFSDTGYLKKKREKRFIPWMHLKEMHLLLTERTYCTVLTTKDRPIWICWGRHRYIGHLWTDISKIFKSSFLLHYQKYSAFHALPFF